MLTQIAWTVVLIGAAVAVVLWVARPVKCTHPEVTFDGLQNSALVWCEDCGRAVEWHEVAR